NHHGLQRRGVAAGADDGHHCAWSAFNAASTASACPATLSLRLDWTMRLSGEIRKVLRSMPRTCLPYMFLSLMSSKAVHSASSASLTSGKRKPCFAQKLSCDFTESRETPSTTAPAFSNAGSSALKSRPSVVQPGVLSLG